MLSTLPALLLLASTSASAIGKAPQHIAPQKPSARVAASFTDAGPEPALIKVFDSIKHNDLDLALQQSEAITRAFPNFRLAHLIQGDLLLARGRSLKAFGEGGKSTAGDKISSERINDLREEAVVRLKSYLSRPTANFVPRYLLQMLPEQKHAIVVDAQKSRLYLYANDKGTPRFVTDYYITQGKLGAEKSREGDKKTPIGVYHVTSSLPRDRLTNFYGTGAFPINYPNDWDKRQGRDGHGIWLHGTPPDTFSRPPKASDGCVVLSNPDLDALAKSLQVGLTPVIISPTIEWLSLADWQNERQSLLKIFEEWRQDWESRDIRRYARHYSSKFNADGQNYRSWIEQKQKVNTGKSWIKVDANNVSMFRNPGKEDHVVVTFEQDYRSSNLSNQMRKRQYWVKEEGSWKIVSEGSV
ncbi:MAG TPA: L,D-transpeptidase family protein [Rhodocyclaceae bacterium]|nr:L,D-transpeptidase family protein [Rhodocyclaceae bacterium]